MAEVNGTNAIEADRESVMTTHKVDEQGQDIEDEKERIIAKAALSIAELGELQRLCLRTSPGQLCSRYSGVAG